MKYQVNIEAQDPAASAIRIIEAEDQTAAEQQAQEFIDQYWPADFPVAQVTIEEAPEDAEVTPLPTPEQLGEVQQ